MSMKLRLSIFLLVLFGMASCATYTCPTYTKHDSKKEIVTMEKENC